MANCCGQVLRPTALIGNHKLQQVAAFERVNSLVAQQSDGIHVRRGVKTMLLRFTARDPELAPGQPFALDMFNFFAWGQGRGGIRCQALHLFGSIFTLLGTKRGFGFRTRS